MGFALSSSRILLSMMFCCITALSPLNHTSVVGEKENEETVKTAIFLPAYPYSGIFIPGQPSQWRRGYFCIFPCLPSSCEPVTGERTADGSEIWGEP